MLNLATCALLALLAPQEGPPAPAAQGEGIPFEELGPSRFRARLEPLPKLDSVTLWFGVEVGSAHDPLGECGLAQVVAAALRASMPNASDSAPREVRVLRNATLVGVTVPRDDAAVELRRFAGWLRGELDLDDDALVKARGRALLRADDESRILPGPILRNRARRALRPDEPEVRPPAGRPDEIRALEPDDVRARLGAAWCVDRAFLVALGACDEALREAVVAAFGELPPGDGPLPSPVPEAAAAVEPETRHDRVGAPFVVEAFPAPRWGEEGFLPFLFAIEVARTRAAHTFATLRGGELEAEFPSLWYDLAEMPPLFFVERRGRDGDSAESVREEIRSLVAGLAAARVAPGEIRTAMISLSHRLQLPPFRDADVATMGRFPVYLHQRGGTIALYVTNGWPRDLTASLGAVPVTAVQKSLAATFAAERGRFFALVPE